MRANILLVEDEEALRMLLGDRLRNEGYFVECASDGPEGSERATSGAFDLIILDVMLPHGSGFDVCSDIRRAGLITPIIMLTARGQTEDKVAGLNIGADDYITKPFEVSELLARIEALLRRAPTMPPRGGIYQFGTVRIDVRGTQVTRNGKIVNLSAREFHLLRYLVEHRGTTLSRDELLKQVWGYSSGTYTRTVDVHVSSLRDKLKGNPQQPDLILTVKGIGYKIP